MLHLSLDGSIFTLDPYLIRLSIKQGDIKYLFSSLWYDLSWNWTPVSRAIVENCTNWINTWKNMTVVQNDLSLTQKEEYSWTFLSWKQTMTSYKTRKNGISFSSFISSNSVLPQQKFSILIFIQGEELIFLNNSYVYIYIYIYIYVHVSVVTV